MLEIDGTTIRLTRGDSAWISIPIQTEAGDAYTGASNYPSSSTYTYIEE